MAEGQMGQETLNDASNTFNNISNSAEMRKLQDKAIDSASEKIGGAIQKKLSEPATKEKIDKFNKKCEEKTQKSNELCEKINENKKNIKDGAKEIGKSALHGDGQGMKDGAKKIGKNALDKGKNQLKKAKTDITNPKKLAAGLEAAANKVSDATSVNNGESSGEIVDQTSKAVEETAKTTAKVAANLAAGNVVGAVKALLDNQLVRKILTVVIIGVAIAALIPLIVCIMLLLTLGLLAFMALGKLSEAFTAVSEMINPTEYESFTMEDQYEILAEAFGDEVFRAYEKMVEEVEDTIDEYADSSDYNEWDLILEYNSKQNRIDYDRIYTSSDSMYTGDGENSIYEQGMPGTDAGATTVYIGGYEGDITDTEWGVNGKGSGVDQASKTDPNFNKGLLKTKEKDSDPDVYATGNEVYFDAAEVRDNLFSTAGYAAVSDMAYMVAGYNVSMMEAPIIDFGEKVSKLKAGATIIKYKVDIGVRVFSNTFENNAEKYGGGIWGTIASAFSTGAEWMTNQLAKIFDGETSFFTYDASLVEAVSDTQTRTVMQYSEKIYEIQEEQFIYNVEYDTGCKGHTADDGSTYTDDCDGDHKSITYTYTVPHQDYLDAATYEGYEENKPKGTDEKYINAVTRAIRGKNISVSYLSSQNYGNSYPLNRSRYISTTKSYEKYSLNVPMSAFDVDRMLKALFETSPYYGELTYYYTDRQTTYGYTVDGDSSDVSVNIGMNDSLEDGGMGENYEYAPTKIDGSQDQVLAYYGKYIDEWKYAYSDKEIQYTSYDGSTVTRKYSTGEAYDNGIDSQPYFQQSEVYLYSCGCDTKFGIYKNCPTCGEEAIQRSSEIAGTDGSDVVQLGSGDRALTYMGMYIVWQNGYFDTIIDDEDITSWRDAQRVIKQNTMQAMTTTDKIVIDDYTGGQVGGSYANFTGGIGSQTTTNENLGNSSYKGGTATATTSGSSTTGSSSTSSSSSSSSSSGITASFSPVTTTLTGDSNTTKVWNFLTQTNNFTEVQAAAIMGNIQQESTFNPSAVSASGNYIGLCQWGGSRKTNLEVYCAMNGYEVYSLEGQLSYLMYELNGSYKSLLSKAGFFDDNITPEKASDIFLTKFEGAWAQQAKEREGYASSFYNTKGVSAGKPSCNGDGNGGSTSSSDTSSYTGGTTSDGQTNAVINNVVTTHTNIEVVLTDETTFDEDGNPITYYPITVLDRVLSVKDAVLNVLENSEYIQSEMASRGLTYDAQTNTTSTGNWVWDETQGKYVLSGTNGFNTDEMVNYVSTTIKDVTSYGAITELTDGTFAIGIGSWTGEDAKALLKEIISKNPDAYRRICQSNGISEIDFTTNWSSTKNSDYSKISSVISSLLTLEGAKSIQDDKFNAKVETVVNYMIGNHITDSATLAFLSSIAMYFDDISKLGSAGGDMAMFREYVMNASITAGSDNSFQMAFEAAFKWVGDSGNTYASPAIKTKISEYYSTIKAAKENGTLPKMYTQGLAENVEPIIDMATTFAGDDYFPYFHYSTYTADNCKKKSGQQHTLIARQSIQTIASNMQSIYDSQSGYISGDCSSFVAALFYNFGYNVPTSSGAWKGNSYGYKEFTDSSQLQPGDVIVWRTPGSSTGHVELYIGNGASIGFGSEPVTIHSNWNCFNGYQTVSFYRVID